MTEKNPSELEALLMLHIRAHKIPTPMAEYKFNPKRKFRFDFAWPDYLFAVEIEGGIWINGRHNTGIGFENDCIKYQDGILLGWDIYRVTGGMIKSGMAINTIKTILEMKGAI